jgi:hypothetical protein
MNIAQGVELKINVSPTLGRFDEHLDAAIEVDRSIKVSFPSQNKAIRDVESDPYTLDINPKLDPGARAVERRLRARVRELKFLKILQVTLRRRL